MHISIKSLALLGLLGVATALPTHHSKPSKDSEEVDLISGHWKRDAPTHEELSEFATASSEEIADRISVIDHKPTKEELGEVLAGDDVAPKEEQVTDDELGKFIFVQYSCATQPGW
jgi:hypothetical protein